MNQFINKCCSHVIMILDDKWYKNKTKTKITSIKKIHSNQNGLKIKQNALENRWMIRNSEGAIRNANQK